METVVTTSFIGGFFLFVSSIFILQLQSSNVLSETLDQRPSYVWASYAAEAKINEELYNLKTSDVDTVSKMKELASYSSPQKGNYSKINVWAPSSYFDLKLDAAPDLNIDLWKIVWWDLFFKSIDIDKTFDTFYLNYNKWTSESLLVELIRFDRTPGVFSNCDFYSNYDWLCNNWEKLVINTLDPNLNGVIKQWVVTYYRAWTNGFNNQIILQWLQPMRYDYRLVFSTNKGTPINFWYYVTYNWNKQLIANNFIEMEVTGNAIDNYSRIKLQKNINNNLQPNTKYVLFWDGEIAK